MRPNRQLVRSRSDENLDIQRRTHFLLKNAEIGLEALSSLRKRRPSDGSCPEGLELWSRTSMTAELESFKRPFDKASVSHDTVAPC